MQNAKKSHKVSLKRAAEKKQVPLDQCSKKNQDASLGKKRKARGVATDVVVSTEKADVAPCVASTSASLSGVKVVARETNERKCRKRQLRKSEEDEGSGEGNEDGEKLSEPKRKQKRKEDSPTHMQGQTQYVRGTSLKICANCGTASEKTKAKKCQKCKKFFFNHWSNRCRIPPCPKCHYSRKAKTGEEVPVYCELCGYKLQTTSEDQPKEFDKIACSSNEFAVLDTKEECSDAAKDCGKGPSGNVHGEMETDCCILKNKTSSSLAAAGTLNTLRRRGRSAHVENPELEEGKRSTLASQGELAATEEPKVNIIPDQCLAVKKSDTLCESAEGLVSTKLPDSASQDVEDVGKRLRKVGGNPSYLDGSSSEVDSMTKEESDRGKDDRALVDVDNVEEATKDVEAALLSEKPSLGRQGIVLSPVSSQGSNNDNRSLRNQTQFPVVNPTILNSTTPLPLSGEIPRGMSSPKRTSHTLLPLPAVTSNQAVIFTPAVTSNSTVIPNPALTSNAAVTSNPAVARNQDVTHTQPVASNEAVIADSVVVSAVVPTFVAGHLATSASLAKNSSAYISLASSIIDLTKPPAVTTSTGSTKTTLSSAVVTPVSLTTNILAGNANSCSTPKLLAEEFTSTNRKLTGITLTSPDSHNYGSSNACCLPAGLQTATTTEALPLKETIFPTVSSFPFSTKRKEALTSSLPEWEASNMLAIIPELKSHSVPSKLFQPPSLVSNVSCDANMPSVSHSLPDAPRVCITVPPPPPPPPLQNIKHDILGKNYQTYSPQAISGITRLEETKNSETVPSYTKSVLQSAEDPCPPPLVYSFSTSPTFPLSNTTATARLLTSSSTRTIDVVSSISSYPPKFASVINSCELECSPSHTVPSSQVARKDQFPCSAAKVSHHHDVHQQMRVDRKGKEENGSGVSTLVLPSSSFHKLDLSHSVHSQHTNKIRVSLLKVSSEPDRDCISSPPASSPSFTSPTRLNTKYPEFPCHTTSAVDVVTVSATNTSLAAESLTANSIGLVSGFGSLPNPFPSGNVFVSSDSCSTFPTGYVSPSNKFHKLTASQKRRMLATVDGEASKVSPVTLLKQLGTHIDGVYVSVANSGKSTSEPISLVNSTVVSIPDALNSQNVKSSGSIDLNPKLESSPSDVHSTSQQQASGSRLCQVESLEPKMDTVTIERLASNVQMRISNALMPGVTKSSMEEAHFSKTPLSLPLPLVPATTIVGAGPCRASGSYGRILPNLSKYPSTLVPSTCVSLLTSCPPSTPSLVNSTSPSSFSHNRTPGLVTVHVCSSIPATLRLSSIRPLTICQANGDSATGAISPPYSENGGNLESKKSSHSPPSASSFTCSPFSPTLKHRSVMAGGGNVMVTPLSPSLLPAVKTVAQIVTNPAVTKEVIHEWHDVSCFVCLFLNSYELFD